MVGILEPRVWAYPIAWSIVFGFGLILGTLARVERPIGPTDLDQRVVRWVVQHRAEYPTINRVARIVTRSGNIEATGPAVVILSALLIVGRRWRDASAFLMVSVGGQGLTAALKEWFRRDRPDLAGRLAVVRGYSFPSGHSVFAGVVVVIAVIVIFDLVSPARKAVRTALTFAILLLALSVASSRVWLGVHYLTDVLCGFGLGLAWASAIALIRSEGGWAARWLRRDGGESAAA